MKIYTKGGDKGKTSLFNGKRVSKADELVNAYGTVDETNSVIGVARAAHSREDWLDSVLGQIQHDMLDVGATLAAGKPDNPRIGEDDVVRLEGWIDEATAQLPELKNFILPGGHLAAAQLHQARTICRRAERLCVAIADSGMFDEVVIRYLNRLSDLLFTLARYANFVHDQSDVLWEKD